MFLGLLIFVTSLPWTKQNHSFSKPQIEIWSTQVNLWDSVRIEIVNWDTCRDFHTSSPYGLFNATSPDFSTLDNNTNCRVNIHLFSCNIFAWLIECSVHLGVLVLATLASRICCDLARLLLFPQICVEKAERDTKTDRKLKLWGRVPLH